MPPADPLLLMMIETATGLRERAAIASTDGVDGLFVGPYDLSLSTGAAGVDSEQTIENTRLVVDTAAAAGLRSGVFVGRPELLAHYPQVDFLGVASDVGCLSAGIAAAFARQADR
jgi:2-keto-3-deoxy-L-rhamnonate aldolase RhmA